MIRRILIRLAPLVVAALLLAFVILPVNTEQGGLTFVNRVAYWVGDVRRGDLVGVEPDAGRSAIFLKRVVGLPGERFEIRNGVVLVNGALLNEPYVKSRQSSWQLDEVTLADDEYYVIGDDRGQPMSLHRMGRARRQRILGKALW